MDGYCEVVDAAFEAGVRPRCHLEDVTRADIEGFVLPFVERLMRMSEQVPDELSVKIRLCDTMGFGLSFPGVELPRSIPKLIYKLNQEVRRAQRPAGMARAQRLPQGARQRRHGLALRLRRGERHAVRLRRADRQPAAGRARVSSTSP